MAQKSLQIGTLTTPMYCLNLAGSRHLIMAGGGGVAKTGVRNEIQTWLLSYNTDISQAPSSGPQNSAILRDAGCVDTGPHSTMNMDVVPMSTGHPDHEGRFLIATSHDHFCDIYETDGYEVIEKEDEPDVLGLTQRHVARFETVFDVNKKNDKYQKGVKFAPVGGSYRLVTAGSDGFVRTWSVDDIIRLQDRVRPLRQWSVAEGEVADLEVSGDGRLIFTITGKDVKIWDMEGQLLKDVRTPEGYTPRCVRFTNRDRNPERDNIFFAVAYNPTVQRGKQVTRLFRWVFSQSRSEIGLVSSTDVLAERISKISVQKGGKWIAVGLMEGSVVVYRTDDLKAVKTMKNSHRTFITDLQVLPERTEDFPQLAAALNMRWIPGPHSEAEVGVVSIGGDQTVQLHSVPYDNMPSIAFAVVLSFILMLICPLIVALLLKL
ncbi:hypothetical protein L596_016314 [Steinernema carpocapsae]|uniref:Prolactin regulatory element-binding protein n=1 Tax=Steinernema carpocapsae TaxID=34508 RepID=A0A4U5NIL2_STECR|nr:hypothetical protein L596_016314 [Steinernema carpocapsae]